MRTVATLLGAAALSLTSLAASAALAQLYQPDGAQIPAGSTLSNYFVDRGESIDVLAEATIVPEVFYPAGELTFTFVAEGGGYENAFGWYNLGDDVTNPANRHIIFDCSVEPGTPEPEATVSFCGNADWNGGPIGFFIITPQQVDGSGTRSPNCALNDNIGYIYYSEPRFNQNEDSENPYIHHLVYQSSVDATRFYFGFEDLHRGGDNDFEDVLVQVDGLLVEGPRETCDGRDNDCDGDIDEDVVEACSTTCGTGLRICDPDTATFGACTAPTPSAEVCDGVDNDCDGDIDEGLSRACASSCGSGTEICAAGSWIGCTAPASSVEVCDNVDNDCDDAVDEGLTRSCTNACGVAGVETCVAGQYVDCDAPLPTVETCDGRDNDCDGAVDEDLVRACANGCGTGTETCSDGAWIGCTAPAPEHERCDGVDNDCDGAIDEALTQPCSNACGDGVELCRAGEWIGCTARRPGPEVCDNVDNDCDGTTDEELARDCSNGCGAGEETCDGGLWVGCTAPVPAPEACDGVDNDCDGEADEELAIACTSLCGEGLAGCVDGAFASCSAPEPVDEVCDDADNDCDGLVDEGLQQGCETACGSGVEVCEAGAWEGCSAPTPDDEVCDGLDNDCDGEVDEQLTRRCSEGCGIALQVCSFGTWSACPLEPIEEACDGIDNDCDGIVDNGAICPVEGEVCERGQCLGPCSFGECNPGYRCQDDICYPTACSSCRPYEVCVDDACVDTCAGVSCADGETCREGVCVSGDCAVAGCDEGRICADGVCWPDDCWGVACPDGAYCAYGECVASCAGVICDDDEVCELGTCLPSLCDGGCADDELCVDGACVVSPCEDVTCGAGEACVDGACEADPCAAVTCPEGTVCETDPTGEPDCVVGEAPGDDVGPADVGPDAGDDVGVDAGEDTDIATPDADGDVGVAEPETVLECEDTGCNCASTPASRGSSWVWAGLAGMALMGRRRRAWWLALTGLAILLVACDNEQCVTVVVDAGEVDVIDDACVPSTEICDGLDNDCDGRVDELEGDDPLNCGVCGQICAFDNADAACNAGVCVIAACAPGFVNSDGDESNGCEATCEESHDGVEVCDGYDNDCDGVVDDGFDFASDPENCGLCGRTCAADGVAEGECLDGRCVIYACEDGYLNINGLASDGCEYACTPTNRGIEECDGLDNDCDGSVDVRVEDVPPLCFSEGVCRGVSAICRGTDGWQCPYPDLYEAGAEVSCDGRDNDCDGEVDEEFGELNSACDGDDADLCEDGILLCSADGTGTVCHEVRDNLEICDGEDNDCDGETDEGFDLMTDDANCGACRVDCNALGASGSCEGGTCVISGCADGYWDVNGNSLDGCEYACVVSGVEICDGVDNDCNGIIDDNLTDAGSGCLTDGVCSSVRPVCDAVDGWVCAYPTVFQADESLCDGLDNDCDGQTDEAFGTLGDVCDGDDDDLCPGGVVTCTADGTGVLCTDDALSVVEVCDGADNDCDGETDELWDLLTDVSNCGRCGAVCALAHADAVCVDGVCAVDTCDGGYVDSNGLAADGCELRCVPSGPEVCDGEDNDCDGRVDEDLTAPDPDLCDGPGVCAGVPPRCQGARGWECVYPSVYQVRETLCDYLDNDCDGSVDESDDNPSLAPLGTACQAGRGACLSRGLYTCSADQTTASCTAVAGTPSAEICDGIDNDCNGAVDDAIARGVEMVRVTGEDGTPFWIDRYEASRPDASASSRGFEDGYACSREGVLPWENLTWDEAQAACAARGKRLCTDAEWAAACDGTSDSVYPYGDIYSGVACNTSGSALHVTRDFISCLSDLGVYDLSGNVAEWAACENAVDCSIVRPVLGGSYADDVRVLFTCGFRNNLAPATYSGEIGFRCCAD